MISSGLTSVPGWWGAIGRPGWVPDTELGIGFPWTLGGLVAGSWSLAEPDRAPTSLPAPGVSGGQAPLVWSESLAVRVGEGAGWQGFDATLARAHAGLPLDARPSDDWRPAADLVLTTGDYGLSDYALGLLRGDTLGGLRMAAVSGDRGTAGAVAGTGRDLYDLAAGVGRGAHRALATFTHRRSTARLVGGESEDVRGEAGGGAYRFRGERWRVDAEVTRGYDHHDSRGGTWSEQRRQADATGAAVEIERALSRSRWGVRGTWRQTDIRPDSGASGRTRAREGWGSVRWQGPFGDGDLELALGAGGHEAFPGATIAPSLVWRFHGAPWQGRVTAQRMVTPVWADLAPGQPAFRQDTWVGGIDLGARGSGGSQARFGFLVGHTRDRAILTRHPLTSIALRTGYLADARAYDFMLLTAEARARRGRWTSGLEAYLLARDASALQPWVDPGRGGRGFLEARFSVFGGDLRLRPRVEAWAVGPRESEAVPSRTLPGYVTAAAGIEVAIAEAVVLLEGRNLEDRAQPQTWVDRATGGEALGPGLELRLTLTWRLWD